VLMLAPRTCAFDGCGGKCSGEGEWDQEPVYRSRLAPRLGAVRPV